MKKINWNNEKDKKLREERGIGFDDIVIIIIEKRYVEIIENSSRNFQNQKMYVIDFHNYIYLVPFVETENEIFLKTIIPNRKATKFYLGGKENER